MISAAWATGAEAASRSSASIARFTVAGMARASPVALRSAATPTR
jgi:hypothetical protein